MRFGIYSKAEIEVNGESASLLREIEATSLMEARKKAKSLEPEEPEIIVVTLCPECRKPLIEIAFEECGVIYLAEGEYEAAGQTSGTLCCTSCKTMIGGYGQQTWGFVPNFR